MNDSCRNGRRLCWFLIPAFLSMVSGCSYNMSQQPRYNPMSRSDFFTDQRSERPPVEDTVARGGSHAHDSFYTGRQNGTVLNSIPTPLTRELLQRGRERFEIYCSPCHGRLGDGEGMVVLRGFSHPPSYHIDRLRQAPDGHFFEVMTNGIGRMASYANRVTPADRWAIVAYIRALQLSQSATMQDVPPQERQKLLGEK